MKYLTAFIFLLCCQYRINAQDTSKNTASTLTAKEKPGFPGGEKEWRKYLALNLRYPNAALEDKVEGFVIVSFKIGETGKISEVQVLKSLGSGCDEEAMRVVRKMPDWEPAHKDGKAIVVTYYLPIEFELPFDNNEASK